MGLIGFGFNASIVGNPIEGGRREHWDDPKVPRIPALVFVASNLRSYRRILIQENSKKRRYDQRRDMAELESLMSISLLSRSPPVYGSPLKKAGKPENTQQFCDRGDRVGNPRRDRANR